MVCGAFLLGAFIFCSTAPVQEPVRNYVKAQDRMVEEAQPNKPLLISGLIDRWTVAYEECHGTEVDIEACDRQHQMEVALGDLNWCYGRETDAARYLNDWHICDRP